MKKSLVEGCNGFKELLSKVCVIFNAINTFLIAIIRFVKNSH